MTVSQRDWAGRTAHVLGYGIDPAQRVSVDPLEISH